MVMPIFELEDSLLCPLLWAVVEYLEEVLSMMMETGGEQGGGVLPGLHPGGADREGGEALHGAGVWGGGGAQPAQGVTQDFYHYIILPGQERSSPPRTCSRLRWPTASPR